MVIFINFSSTSNHLHSLQVENCDGNSQLVVNEDDNGKFRLERVKFTCMLPMVLNRKIVNCDVEQFFFRIVQ